ncbi:hypothetical protein SDC9_172091 [bioreactor metagenome]|uniref:Uncharacterized protein n=1 Tax=bioreactor metagenome TaxID=1076179 RepID=A0A645GFY8_9ZZZZ
MGFSSLSTPEEYDKVSIESFLSYEGAITLRLKAAFPFAGMLICELGPTSVNGSNELTETESIACVLLLFDTVMEISCSLNSFITRGSVFTARSSGLTGELVFVVDVQPDIKITEISNIKASNFFISVLSSNLISGYCSVNIEQMYEA